MSELERIEIMCIHNRRLLCAIADAMLHGTRDEWADNLRRALKEAQPWREPDLDQPGQKEHK